MISDYRIIEVTSKNHVKEFHSFPARLYSRDKSYIRPFDNDVEAIFDPKRNKYFRNGEAVRYLVADSEGLICGRVAAFYNKERAIKNWQPTGGIGFFDCIDHQAAADTLFGKCVEWLKTKGMEAMDGPINFGEREKFWGLLVKGYTPPNYCTAYNLPYYRKLFENFGFRNYFEQYTYNKSVSEEGIDPVLYEKGRRLMRNRKYIIRHIKRSDYSKIPGWFMTIYNKAWADFQGTKSFSIQHARLLFKQLKPVLDKRLFWFAFMDDEPVAFLLMIPEINRLLRGLNGKLNLYAKIKIFMGTRVFRLTDKALGQIFGVVPEHQRRGIEGAMLLSFAEMALKKSFPYRNIEFNWIGDFNPVMIKLLDQIGGTVAKTHITYRYLFDPEAEFKRYREVN